MFSKKRVAVLFFGQPRHVENRIAAFSHKIWLRRHSVDYFGHCWYGSSGPIQYTKGANVTSLHIPHNAPSILRKQYPGIKLFIDEPREFDPLGYDSLQKRISNLGREEIPRYLGLLPIFLSQFFSISEVIDGFMESQGSLAYDYVVLSRYDNLILYIPDLAKLPKNRLIVSNQLSHFDDLLFIGDTLMISGLNVYKNLDQLFETERNFSPEELKRANFFQYFSKEDILAVDMDLKLIRGESAAKLILYACKRYKNYLKHKLEAILRLQK